MTKYNEAQVDFRDKSKGRIARQLEISELLHVVTRMVLSRVYTPAKAQQSSFAHTHKNLFTHSL